MLGSTVQWMKFAIGGECLPDKLQLIAIIQSVSNQYRNRSSVIGSGSSFEIPNFSNSVAGPTGGVGKSIFELAVIKLMNFSSAVRK